MAEFGEKLRKAREEKGITQQTLAAGVIRRTDRCILSGNLQPDKPTSFEADGELFTATVENGSTMILTLFHSEKCKDWEIALAPEMFVCDYSNEIENGMEFHIIALSEGKGEMAFQCVEEDGSIGKYILTLSISRHKKKYLQIDTVSFLDYESTLRK